MEASVDQAQNDAIVRVASYHRHDFDVAVIQPPPRKWHPYVHPSTRTPSTTSSDGDPLKRLPPEIWTIICLQLDIKSCFRLRQTNRSSRQIVSGIHEYNTVTKHASESFQAIIRTGMSQWFTILRLYKVLCTPSCQVCRNEFGGFLFIPNGYRCCYNCITGSFRLQVSSIEYVCKYLPLQPTSLSSRAPVLRTVPGKYSLNQEWKQVKMSLIWHTHAQDALIASGVYSEDINRVLRNDNDFRMARFMVTTPLPSFNPTTRQIQRGVCCKGCHIELEIAGILAGATAKLYKQRDKVYSKEGFLDHFWKCPQAVALWGRSEQGTVEFNEPRFTKHGGFLKDRED